MIDVDLKDVANYAVLAIEIGGHAVQKIRTEQSLDTRAKGKTDEGKEELLTKADLISNYLILDLLQRFPRLIIVSEEKPMSATEDDVRRYRSESYDVWQTIKEALAKIPSRQLDISEVRVFVDPLDATQEFTENLTEYVTVMACVVLGDEPIFGAIYRPFFNETVFGVVGFGAVNSKGEKIKLKSEEETEKKIVVSRSHAGKVKEIAEKAYGEGMKVEPAGGSGYKTMRLIDGTAEIYLHSTAIKKWDTCAGDAILRSLGGAMLDLSGEPLKYSEKEPILNKKGLVASVRNPYTHYTKIRDFL